MKERNEEHACAWDRIGCIFFIMFLFRTTEDDDCLFDLMGFESLRVKEKMSPFFFLYHIFLKRLTKFEGMIENH